MTAGWMRTLLFFTWASWVSIADKVTEFNYVVGTQAIYGPKWAQASDYNLSSEDALTANTREVVEMGANQLKLRLAHDACDGYRMKGCDAGTSLKTQAQLPAFAKAFAHPDIKWYQMWMYGFGARNVALGNWTAEASELEYQEVKAWAVHMLETYSGTGKVFMTGNWEGDWMLMYASGNCRLPTKKWNMTCELRQEAIDGMVEWGRTRQRAIDDARKEATHHNVSLFYYIEFNLGPEALAGRPGVSNSVIPKVNPDLVSFSSYSSTNKFNSNASELPKVDAAFEATMSHVESKLSPKDLPSLAALGFRHRVFIGEYGMGAGHDMATATRFTARVCHAALKWGTPFVLYWEVYFNGDTVAIIPPSGETTPLWHLFNDYYTQAHNYVSTFAKLHKGSVPSAAEFGEWGVGYFEKKEKGSCQLRPNVTFAGDGYVAPASTADDCWEYCDENPTCAVGVFDGTCHVKYSTAAASAGPGVACVKVADAAGEAVYV